MPRNIFDLGRVPNTTPLSVYIDHYSMPEPNSGCLLWLGNASDGRPKLYWKGRSEIVARLVLEEATGPLQPDEQALHKCDNTYCVELRHLRRGSQSDNMQEMWDKGRHPGRWGTA